MKFCDNPKCKLHIEVVPNTKYLGTPVMSKAVKVTQEEAIFGKGAPTYPGVKVEAHERIKVVRIIDGVEISGYFCEVCYSAISMVEGF